MPVEAKVMDEALENLKLVLTSPRERAKGTIASYLQTARRFLEFLGDKRQPTDKDFRRYFLQRRDQGITERTLDKEFAHLKKLANANQWPWTFTSDDRPVPREEARQLPLTPEEVETLIKAKDKLTKGEQFYLAVSTTWGCRREELLKLRKRDYNEETITITIAKQKKKIKRVRHVMPDEIKPILLGYHPNLKTATALSYMFARIMKKAGLGQRKGYGWHSIREGLKTALTWSLSDARKPVSLIADFMGWSKAEKGIAYGGAPMLGHYDHPEIMAGGPLALDELIVSLHPFLKFWA